MQRGFIKIAERDNVLISLSGMEKGMELEIAGKPMKIRNNVPPAHKIALEDIAEGELVFKYGYPIGKAIRNIRQGDWIHSHNMKTCLDGKKEYQYQESSNKVDSDIVGKKSSESIPDGNNIPCFRGYRRSDGQVGIRNELWLIPTVGCINSVVERMAREAGKVFANEISAGKVDGIHAFTHPYGCSQLGDDLQNTQKILAGLAKNPNAAAVLIVGLGCENNRIEDMRDLLGTYGPERIRYLKLQDVDDDIESALKQISEMLEIIVSLNRDELPVSKLKIGLKCGGSDGFSGITANPLLGSFSDLLVTKGGTSILTEVPEMFGAEQILMDRAIDQNTFDAIVNLINGFKEYFIKNKEPVYENPSPGNKEGGITTLEEKSLGCIQKGGTSIVRGVSFYGEEVRGRGLQLLEAPGNDLVSTTALTAAGAQLILFTSGRGTPFGAAVPTVKIATNSSIYEKKPDWFDFNSGTLLSGKSIEELSSDLFNYILELASGNIRTKNEENNYREIAIFKKGITL